MWRNCEVALECTCFVESFRIALSIQDAGLFQSPGRNGVGIVCHLADVPAQSLPSLGSNSVAIPDNIRMIVLSGCCVTSLRNFSLWELNDMFSSQSFQQDVALLFLDSTNSLFYRK